MTLTGAYSTVTDSGHVFHCIAAREIINPAPKIYSNRESNLGLLGANKALQPLGYRPVSLQCINTKDEFYLKAIENHTIIPSHHRLLLQKHNFEYSRNAPNTKANNETR